MARLTKTDRRKRISATEEELWELAMRDTKTLRKRDVTTNEHQANSSSQASTERRYASKEKSNQEKSEEAEKARHVPIGVNRDQHLRQKGRGVAGVDRRTAERLRKGQLRIEQSLDMHGMTQTEAHAALKKFISHCSNSGYRCVLIITGKGGAKGDEVLQPTRNLSQVSGVLRKMVPRWLEERGTAELVITHMTAAKHHGGEGARYLLLRRTRQAESTK